MLAVFEVEDLLQSPSHVFDTAVGHQVMACSNPSKAIQPEPAHRAAHTKSITN